MLDRDATRRTRLRVLVGEVEGSLARSSTQVSTPRERTALAELARPWTELVELLALGPEPETRECPVCHETGMRAARICGRCWTKLDPVAPPAAG
jgi:uncharacterized paraquat-inducible protein A